MDIEVGLFRQVIKKLWDSGINAYRNADGDLVTLYHDHIQVMFRPLWSEPELEQVLPSEDHPAVGGVSSPYLLMEPITKGGHIVPLMSWLYDPDAKPTPKLHFHLALCRLTQDGDLFSVGYRFESPHGEGTHNYYHAQLIRQFTNGMPAWCNECRELLPETQPAFAVDARDPVSFLLCILISVYGLVHFGIQMRQAAFWNELLPYYRRMACNDFQPA